MAIEAGANEEEPLSHLENDSVPEGVIGARFITDRSTTHAVSQALVKEGWTVVTSETGYLAKRMPTLCDSQRVEVGEFLQALEDHDDVHRVWAAMK
ncbi:MAG TPA: YebC/PmpR family DNA-binding transcriptional regulator [Chthoniobacterales bacterium]|nr:YebC/PmpR family DNA-binding transcriptional regulator [Chthoniobacterales bacterium]